MQGWPASRGSGQRVDRASRPAAWAWPGIRADRCALSAGQGNREGRASKYTRLRREVENAWKVSGHPNIVTLLDVQVMATWFGHVHRAQPLHGQ
jgi:hypothetical protein